jgi:NADPH-ferrihemoprotein reductase
VFGLGNKQYEHFNAMGKKAFTALETLGASPLLRRGDGDDDGCIDDDFDKWTSEFTEVLKSRAGVLCVCECVCGVHVYVRMWVRACG